GIPKEDINRVFERFYRVDKGRSKKVGGTGLGLAIVKHIVKSLGGFLYVNSELNKGSEFIINIPKRKFPY
ncbi:MAG TPA: ATP-binding protein, partial [Peptostreptococcaceae bacterium]|nr:ATP-binding protein [Peptostreptococcaceae bacterium]